MTEEEFLDYLDHSLQLMEDLPREMVAKEAYALVLEHLLEVLNPRDSARGILYSLELKLHNLLG